MRLRRAPVRRAFIDASLKRAWRARARAPAGPESNARPHAQLHADSLWLCHSHQGCHASRGRHRQRNRARHVGGRPRERRTLRSHRALKQLITGGRCECTLPVAAVDDSQARALRESRPRRSGTMAGATLQEPLPTPGLRLQQQAVAAGKQLHLVAVKCLSWTGVSCREARSRVSVKVSRADPRGQHRALDRAGTTEPRMKGH